MKKIVLLALMMLPGVILGQVNDLTGYNEFSEEMIENYRQLPAADQHLALMLLKSVQYDNKRGYWVYANDTIRNPEVMALRIKEQNKVTEICNIPFGSSYEKSKKILRKEYGNSNAYTSTKDCLVYNNKIFGGILFTDMLFMFQHDEQKSYLNKQS